MRLKILLRILVIIFCLYIIVFISFALTPQNNACGGKSINILTTYKGDKFGGGKYLQGVLDALDFYNIVYDFNQKDVEKYDVNIIFNFKCWDSDYGDSNYIRVLLHDQLKTKSTFFMFPLAWDQIIYSGCPNNTHIGYFVSENKEKIQENMRLMHMVGEIPLHKSNLELYEKKYVEKEAFVICSAVSLPSLTRRKQDRHGAILYTKHVKDEKVVDLMKEILKSKKIEYVWFDYAASYKNEEYIAALTTSTMMIAINDFENFGHAMQSAKAHDVPIFGTNTILERGFFSEECGMLIDARSLSPDQIRESFDAFLQKVESEQYQPREFVKKILSQEIIYKNTLDVICNLKQDTWWT